MLEENLTEYVHFPPIIGVDKLSQLLHRKASVISHDRCLRPHTLPPACVIPDTRKPLWVTEDVVNWLRQYKETSTARLGAPTKASRIKSRETELSILNQKS